MPKWNLRNLINPSNQRKIHASNTLMLISSNKRTKNNSDRASKLRINPKFKNRRTRQKMHRRTRSKMRMRDSHRRKFHRLQAEEPESQAREEAEVARQREWTPSMVTQMALALKGNHWKWNQRLHRPPRSNSNHLPKLALLHKSNLERIQGRRKRHPIWLRAKMATKRQRTKTSKTRAPQEAPENNMQPRRTKKIQRPGETPSHHKIKNKVKMATLKLKIWMVPN